MTSLGLDSASPKYQLIRNEKSNTNFSRFKYLNHLSGEASWNGCGILLWWAFFALFAQFDFSQGQRYLMNIICWFAKFCLLIFIQSKYFPGTTKSAEFYSRPVQISEAGNGCDIYSDGGLSGGTSGHLLLCKYCNNKKWIKLQLFKYCTIFSQ